MATVTVELVFFELAAERVAMNSQSARGAALVAFHVIHDAFDETALEFGERFFKQDAAFHHLPNKGFQLILHNCILRSADAGLGCRVRIQLSTNAEGDVRG